MQMWELQHSALTGTPLMRDGRHHPNIKSPYGVYTTADGVSIVFIQAMTDDSWTSFWIFADRPEALLMEEWNTAGKRIGATGSVQGLAEIRSLMQEAVASKTFSELEVFFSGEPEIIWERVRDHADVLTDPQNIHNGYVVDLEVPQVGATKTVGSLMAFSQTPTDLPRPPPGLGADTAGVMKDLGFAAEAFKSVASHNEATRQEMLAALLGEA